MHVTYKFPDSTSTREDENILRALMLVDSKVLFRRATRHGGFHDADIDAALKGDARKAALARKFQSAASPGKTRRSHHARH
jgi:hypothetical protein